MTYTMHFRFLIPFILFLFPAIACGATKPGATSANASQNPAYIAVKQGDLYGYITTEGSMVIEAQFDYAESFFEGLAAVRTPDGKWGYIDKSGDFAIAPVYGHASHFGQGLGFVEADGKFGFINHQGEMMIKPRFDGGGSFVDEVATILIGDKWGYIDTDGKTVIKPQFDNAEDFHEDLARICIVPEGEKCFRSDNRKFGFINKRGEIVIPAQFDYAEHFSEGLAMARIDDLYGFIDKTGHWAIKPVYTNAAMAFSDGLAHVTTQEGKNIFIDNQGGSALKPPTGYHAGEQFTNGLVMAMDQASGKWGYMNRQGEMVIPAKYDRVLPFKGGVAPASMDRKWGLIDLEGKWLAEPSYDRIGPL